VKGWKRGGGGGFLGSVEVFLEEKNGWGSSGFLRKKRRGTQLHHTEKKKGEGFLLMKGPAGTFGKIMPR